MRIAIIGSGISGLGAAWLLNTSHDITLFEADQRLGGHSNTIDIDYDGTVIAIDTGFIVYNERNYPNLTALFAHLGVSSQASDMSFAVSAGGGETEWASDSLDTVFAQRRNLLRPRFIATVMQIRRFNRDAPKDLAMGHLAGLTLKDYLTQKRYSEDFRNNYLFPMGGAIWSMPNTGMNNFPAESFVGFCKNHYLLDRDRPRWRTVAGGSREYVKKITAHFADRIHTNAKITGIEHENGKVQVRSQCGQSSLFDHVILAVHGDQALQILQRPTNQERKILGTVHYAPNLAYVHRDPSLMPRLRKVWSSWNYMSADAAHPEVSVSYWMNRLQNIDAAKPLFITLNPAQPPKAELTFAVLRYDHVQYDLPTLMAQRQLSQIQGKRNIWYCGAWTAHGFHEDGLTSGLNVAEQISGLQRPWSAAPRTMLQEAAE